MKIKPLIEKHVYRNSGSLSFGIQLCKERKERLAPGESFETLNTNKPLRTIPFNEFYIMLGLGICVLSIGFIAESRWKHGPLSKMQ